MRAGEILELNTFLAVAETGRFAAAAARLGVTPSAVSQSIRRLETRFGVRLLSRTTRSVALTAAGEALLHEVKPALARLATASQAVDQTQEALGRAVIGLSAVAMELLLIPVVDAFRAAHPQFRLDLVVEDRLSDPVASRFDAVIRRGDLLQQDMIARRLDADDELILVAAPSWLAMRDVLHPRDLADQRIGIRRPRSGAMLPWSLRRRDETVKLRGSPTIVVESSIAARLYAIAGQGVALLASKFVAQAIGKNVLQRVLPEWNWPAAGFHLMYADRGSLHPAIRELEAAMRREASSSADTPCV